MRATNPEDGDDDIHKIRTLSDKAISRLQRNNMGTMKPQPEALKVLRDSPKFQQGLAQAIERAVEITARKEREKSDERKAA